MMSPVFKFHLLVPAAERRGVKPEKIGQCRVWAECGVEGSGPVGRQRERGRESAELRHSLGQQSSRQTLSPGALSRPSTHTNDKRSQRTVSGTLNLQRLLDHGTMTL